MSYGSCYWPVTGSVNGNERCHDFGKYPRDDTPITRFPALLTASGNAREYVLFAYLRLAWFGPSTNMNDFLLNVTALSSFGIVPGHAKGRPLHWAALARYLLALSPSVPPNKP